MSHPPTVTLFIPCLVDSMFPAVGEAMVDLFDHLAVPVDYPADQTCCGQPPFNSGYRREAAAAAQHFLNVFDQAEVIVCPSGSCVHMVRHHYPSLFQDDPRLLTRAESVGKRTFELTEYLIDVLGVTDTGAVYPGRVTYHDSCHLARELGIRQQPRQLLNNVRGLELVEMAVSDRCCGFGGTFAVHYPEISTAMVDDKIDAILASGADTVTGCDISCLMNIQGRVSRRGEDVQVLHIAQLLAPGGGKNRG